MKKHIENFIATYENVYPEGYCEFIIDEFERLIKLGAGVTRQQHDGVLKHIKNDLSLFIQGHSYSKFDGLDPVLVFFEGLQKCYDDYIEEISVLKNNSILSSFMKIQRTDPGGGYHVWHFENGNANENCRRVLVYSLYLNSFEPEEGGETEFLYQKIRIKPKKNTLIIWPASFTHTHRGNLVLGEKSKYIITGWFQFN